MLNEIQLQILQSLPWRSFGKGEGCQWVFLLARAYMQCSFL